MMILSASQVSMITAYRIAQQIRFLQMAGHMRESINQYARQRRVVTSQIIENDEPGISQSLADIHHSF